MWMIDLEDTLNASPNWQAFATADGGWCFGMHAEEIGRFPLKEALDLCSALRYPWARPVLVPAQQ